MRNTIKSFTKIDVSDTVTECLYCIDNVQSLIDSNKFVHVDQPRQKPCWELFNKLLALKCSYIWTANFLGHPVCSSTGVAVLESFRILRFTQVTASNASKVQNSNCVDFTRLVVRGKLKTKRNPLEFSGIWRDTTRFVDLMEFGLKAKLQCSCSEQRRQVSPAT